jgi:hypothetical protein
MRVQDYHAVSLITIPAHNRQFYSYRETGLLIPSSHAECRRRKRMLMEAAQQQSQQTTD